MATKITATTNTQRETIGHEEYSLYSSMSEDELIQLAIEQSLTEDPSGQSAAQSHQKSVMTAPGEPPTLTRPCSHNPPHQINTWHRLAAQTGGQAPGSSWGVRRRYDGSLFITPQPVELDPVVEAIKEGDESALLNMMKSGKNLSEPNKDGWIPLHEAAYYGQVGCLKVLQRACERKNIEAVRMLVQYNADANHRCNRGWTALHEAVSRNDIEIIDILIKGGAKIESKNTYGITSLFVAAEGGQLDALRYLAKCGADINTQASDSASALYEACKNGHEKVVEFLLSQGADANKTNKDGLLPLHIASKKGNYEIVKMLLPVTSRTRVKRSGISPLHLAAERNNNDILEELIEAGYDVNTTLSFERARLYEDRRSTVLYFAVINNNIYATELLLQAGANPNIDLINPLLISIRHGCLKTMKLLLDHGANIDAYISSHPTTFPATIMFSMKYLSVLKFLMDLGCDADSCFKCQYGNGPHPVLDHRRDRLDDTPVNKQPNIVQFCDMVSAPEMNRWAGPIIDVLLDYVGNVQLCARLKEHIDSYEDWAVVKEKAEPPRPLAHLCRIKVRNMIGRNRISLIDTLPLPGRLIRYLQYDYSQ
ncbi:ankyrin repeat and SOCS box protein 2 isoform X2 [Trachemys scripta elegans]|uniref:ankyrin repeat and SOCS box protein 2 isoform X2 n=1 Tax=Trachemys scripta elegans TaxID=31138 RepID=UPI001553E1AE|nr:ankyrin repeat and SOCS box protein 2 isoform X2 [Trachemys scripta elegans]